MKSRLTIAFILVAVGSALVVGATLLALNRLNASSQANKTLETQLSNATQLVRAGQGLAGRSPRRSVPDLRGLNVMTLNSSGRASAIGSGNFESGSLTISEIRPSQYEDLKATGYVALESDQFKVASDRGGKYVAAIGMLDGIRVPGNRANDDVVVGAYTEVVDLDTNMLFWWLLSLPIVAGVAAGAASMLSQRFTAPITSIEAATEKIAMGNLSTRIDPSGPEEIQQLGESVNKMASDLERSKLLDRQFVLAVSHDLRTPLTVIKGYGEGLAEGAVDDPVAAGEAIEEHSKRLELLVTDLLDLARIDANQFRLESSVFSLSVLVEEIVDGLSNGAAENSVSIQLAPAESVDVEADRLRCSQVLSNVIENAIKYTDSSVAVALSVGKQMATVNVIDDGPGIASENIDRVFDRFFSVIREGETARKSLGLGLAISKELAHAMGGDLSVSSQLGEGTKMSFSIPVAYDKGP